MTKQIVVWLLALDPWMDLKALAGCPPLKLLVSIMWTDVFAVKLTTDERCYAAAAAAAAVEGLHFLNRLVWILRISAFIVFVSEWQLSLTNLNKPSFQDGEKQNTTKNQLHFRSADSCHTPDLTNRSMSTTAPQGPNVHIRPPKDNRDKDIDRWSCDC